MKLKSLLFLGVFSVAGIASASISDDFESGLSGWTGQGGGSHQGVVVADPLNALNNVLSFTGLNSGGDIYSTATVSANAGDLITLSFDYLGMPGQGNPGNLGGFAGISAGYPGNHTWGAGTDLAYVGVPQGDLVDDGAWHSYIITFLAGSSHQTGGTIDTVHMMFEDFVGSGGVAGDAYFDNVKLEAVPEPASMAALALGALGFLRRRNAR
jgi:hypothetical protein